MNALNLSKSKSTRLKFSSSSLSDMPEVPVASEWQSQGLKNPGLCSGPRTLCHDVLHETMNE